MEDTATTLFVWGFDPEVKEADIFNLLYNNGGISLVSVSIERDEVRNSLGRARAVFINREHAEAAMLSDFPVNMNKIGMSIESFPEQEVTEMTQGSISQVNSLGRGRPVFRNLEHNQDAMVVSSFPLSRSPIYIPLYSFPEWRIPAGVTEMTQGSTSQVNSFQEWTIPAEMTQVSTSHVNSLGQGSAMFRNPQHAQGAMVLPHFPHSSVYQWTIPAEMTQVSTSHVNSLGQGSAMFTNPQHVQGAMVPPHFPHSSVLQWTIPAEMTQGSTSQVVGQSRMGDLHVANQRYEEIKEGMEKKLILYVGNFSYDLEETGLRKIFSPFGMVTSCTIRRDKVSGRSMGDGFVHFLTTEHAEKAISLDGQMVNGRKIWVSFAKAQSKV